MCHLTVTFLCMVSNFKICSLSKQLSNIQDSIINYSHHAVHYIPRTYASYNWKFVPFHHLHSHLLSHSLPLTTTSLFSVSMRELIIS